MVFLIAMIGLLFFLCVWTGVCVLISIVSGWTSIARRYRATGPHVGRTLRMQSAKFGWADYNGCLTIGVSEEGLRISVWPFFRIGHPPVFIPWSDLRVIEVRDGKWRRDVTVDVGTPTLARLRLPLKIMGEAGRLQKSGDGASNQITEQDPAASELQA